MIVKPGSNSNFLVQADLTLNSNKLISISPMTLAFNHITKDLKGCFNTSTYSFTAPEDGLYIVDVKAEISFSAADYSVTLKIMVNGTVYSYNKRYSVIATNNYDIIDIVPLKSGDVLRIDLANDAPVEGTMFGGEDRTFIKITRNKM